MRGVDTNVLVRLLVSDDLRQQRRVTALIEKVQADGESLLVTPVVLAELSWVLEASYGYGKGAIREAILSLLDAPPFVVRPKAPVEQALEWYETGPADFADYLILSLALSEGGPGLVTFDGDLLKRKDCERP